MPSRDVNNDSCWISPAGRRVVVAASGEESLDGDNEDALSPVAALHPDQQRLAIAQPDHIAVIHLPAR